ncbi:hypothetical protein EMIT0111MI5_160141 [Burkholderia sp. IT-111MI5]
MSTRVRESQSWQGFRRDGMYFAE